MKKKVLGSLILSSLVNQSRSLNSEPSWICVDSSKGYQGPAYKDKYSRTFTCSTLLYIPEYFLFLYKLQSINHFLWISAPAQIFLPGREVFADMQLNSSLLNTVPSYRAKQKAHLHLPSVGSVGTSFWAKSRDTTDVPSFHHTASPSLSWSSCFSLFKSYLTSRWLKD